MLEHTRRQIKVLILSINAFINALRWYLWSKKVYLPLISRKVYYKKCLKFQLLSSRIQLI